MSLQPRLKAKIELLMDNLERYRGDLPPVHSKGGWEEEAWLDGLYADAERLAAKCGLPFPAFKRSFGSDNDPALGHTIWVSEEWWDAMENLLLACEEPLPRDYGRDQPDQNVDLREQVRDALTTQQRALMDFMWNRKYGTDFQNLYEVDDAWSTKPSDRNATALKSKVVKINERLVKAGIENVTLEVSGERLKLDRPT